MKTETNQTAARAATLALASCKAFLACLKAGRLPGRKNSRKALRLATKAFQQHRRAGAILAELTS